MTLEEMKKKYLSLIEELNPDSEHLTDDPDIAAKQNEVINQRMFELARVRKLAKYTEIKVAAGDLITFDDISKSVGYDVYQRGKTCGVRYVEKANGTVLKILESGTLEIDCFVYPERITEKTKDKAYEFELSHDLLEIMPYGIAADLLKNDVSAGYGSVYANEYEKLLSRVDPRNSLNSIYIKGGVNI